MDGLEAEVDRLKAEASEQWGKRWTIEVSRYADGDFNAYAVQHHGSDENGHLVQERLYITEDDEVLISERTSKLPLPASLSHG